MMRAGFPATIVRAFTFSWPCLSCDDGTFPNRDALQDGGADRYPAAFRLTARMNTARITS